MMGVKSEDRNGVLGGCLCALGLRFGKFPSPSSV